jgi:hypothetical protein
MMEVKKAEFKNYCLLSREFEAAMAKPDETIEKKSRHFTILPISG